MSVATATKSAQFTIARKQLADALARLDRSATKFGPSSNVKVSINGHATIAAVNQSTAHVESLECDRTGELECYVNAKSFRKLVTSSKAREVTVTINNEKLFVESASIKNTEFAEDVSFPVNQLDDRDSMPAAIAAVELPGCELAEMLEYCLLATDPDSSRFALGACLIEFHPETETGIVVVGTDGRRLHYATYGSEHSSLPKHSALIGGEDLATLAKASANSKVVKIELTAEDVDEKTIRDASNEEPPRDVRSQRVIVTCDNTQFCFKLVNGRFPNWRQVIPADVVTVATGNALGLRSLFVRVKSVLKLSGDETNGAIVGVADLSQTLFVKFESEDASITEMLAVETGWPTEDTPKLDVDFCRDAIPASSAKTQRCTVNFASSKANEKPVVFRGQVGKVNWTAIVMSMAIQ
jgi:DNA polymerase III sliding clamp (beta) subunit (PCNA family)